MRGWYIGITASFQVAKAGSSGPHRAPPQFIMIMAKKKTHTESIIEFLISRLIPSGLDDLILLKRTKTIDSINIIFYDPIEDMAIELEIEEDRLYRNEYFYKDIVSYNSVWNCDSHIRKIRDNSFKCVGFNTAMVEMLKFKLKKYGIKFNARTNSTYWNGRTTYLSFPDDADAAAFQLFFNDLFEASI